MKRFVSSAFALLALLVSGSGQVLFHDDFQNAMLNRYAVGAIDTSWTLYNDENVPSNTLSMFDAAWNVYRDNDGSTMAVSVSFFSKPATADRWLVSPSITLSPDKKSVLFFRAKGMTEEAANRDGFEVKLSVSGKEKNDFTQSLQTVRIATSSWKWYSIDLSEYAGKDIRIAFIQNSTDKYMIALDDIAVLETEASSALMCGIAVPAEVIMPANTETVTVKALLLNTGSDPIVSYTLCLQTDQEVQKEEVSGVNIAPSATADVERKSVLNSVGNHTVRVWVEDINGGEKSSNIATTTVYSILQSSLPRKNVLLEMFSSGQCPSCAPLNSWVHPIFVEENANATDNSGHLSVVKYQVNIPAAGDPTVTEQTLERAELYNVSSAPSVFMNGRNFPHRDTTFGRHLRDSVAKFIQQTVSTGLEASLEREGNTFKIQTTVTNYLNDINDYNIVICLIEDSIHHSSTMHNGEKDFYNVVRQMIPDVTGEPLPALNPGESTDKYFEYTFDAESPQIYSSLDNMGAVIFLQNNKNRQVSQAFYLKPGHSTVANEKKQPVKRQLYLYPNPVNEQCTVMFDAIKNGPAVLRIFDGQGKTVRVQNILLQAGENRLSLETASLAPGLYFVSLRNEQGVFTHKLMKR